MRLKFLDPEITRKMLEGHEDVLTPASEDREKFYASQVCMRCGGSCRKVGDSRTMYVQGDILPRFYLECLACGCEFNPHNGLVIKMGNVGQAVVPAVPLINND